MPSRPCISFLLLLFNSELKKKKKKEKKEKRRESLHQWKEKNIRNQIMMPIAILMEFI